MEKWKDIPGYEGFYQASTLGRIRSCERKILRSDGVYRRYRRRILKTRDNRKGYLTVGLTKNKKQTDFRVHQLIAMTFLGHERSGNTIVVDHINAKKYDNRLCNLQLLSHGDNIAKGHERRRVSILHRRS